MRLKYTSVLALGLLVFGCQPKLDRLAKNEYPSSFENVLIDDDNISGRYKPCEPSIFINPVNSNNIVAAAVLNKTYTSLDGGRNWQTQEVESTFGVYGDPVIYADYTGNFYFAHLADPSGKGRSNEQWLDRIVIQKSTDQGRSWNNGSFTGHRPPHDQDKHWLAADKKTHHLYITWTEFDKYGSRNAEDHSRILFSKSSDFGQSWSEAISISEFEGDCIDSDNTTEGAVPAVGLDGTVYVSWSLGENIYFDRSRNGGDTWLDQDIVAATQFGGWDIDIPGLSRANGMPVTGVDISNSPFKGSIYINYCDQKNGTDDTDVWLVKSTDGGDSWSEPKRVNDDPAGRHQFFTWMSVDPVTGAIYIIFYDRRAYGDDRTDVYLAYSFDGGRTFKNIKVSKSPFIPSTKTFFGDYNNISAFGGVVRPIWTRMDNNQTSIWTALIDFK